MGGNCCVAARKKPMPHRISCEVSSYRNVRHSPSWSFRWDNRTHIEDIMDNPSWFSQQNSGNLGSQSKSAADTETDGLSDVGSPLDSRQTPKWQKKGGLTGSSKSIISDQSTRSNSPLEGKGSLKSTAASASDTKPSVSIPSSPSSRAADPSSSSRRCSSLQLEASSSRKARRSPGYQLSRQISNSRMLPLKSLNKSSSCSPEGRQSFVVSGCSNDLSTAGSHGSSSDGWSMRTFSELVAASSQRERWSVDSETPSSFNSKTARSSPPALLPTCGVCSKSLKDKSPWSGQKIVSTNELSVAAVLVCGHIYHAECLESVTSEIDKYDPACPICASGDKSVRGKAEQKAKNKISRRAVADMDVDGDSAPDRLKWGQRSLIMGASSSMKASLGSPFMKRHFSIGSRPPPARSASESQSTRKAKGFWSRYRKD